MDMFATMNKTREGAVPQPTIDLFSSRASFDQNVGQRR